MENIWQSSKIYRSVSNQHVVYGGVVTWSHSSSLSQWLCRKKTRSMFTLAR